MATPHHIRIEEFQYSLPDDRIAKYPLSQRDGSQLLVYAQGHMSTSLFTDLPSLLPPETLLVCNNTKVIEARLHFVKETGAVIEIFCLEPYSPVDYLSSFSTTDRCEWLCMIGNLKRWKEGELSLTLEVEGQPFTLRACRGKQVGEAHQVVFSWDNPHITFAAVLHSVGELPIPPYLNRSTQPSDKEGYQTVYSKIDGSVAAPTAGLHFTPAVLDAIGARGIQRVELTLHVGAGTFKPVKTDTIGEHAMHSELIEVDRSVVEAVIASVGNIVAVGTTSVRTLESLYHLGVMLLAQPHLSVCQLEVSQWQPYTPQLSAPSVEEALHSLLDYLHRNNCQRIIARTQILIAPGYTFRVVDGMITNFHQPQSTLLLLVSAFVAGNWRALYTYAMDNDYRFLSYGDSSLLWRTHT